MRPAGLLAVPLALLLCASLAAPTPAAAKPVRAKHLIVKPRAGKRVPARPLLIRIRARGRARVGARLNGRRIGRFLSRPSRRGLRRLRVSPTYGLRHGRNVLWVRVRYRRAKRARVQRVRFRVARNRPLAAAGRNRRVAQHARFHLDGRRSRPRPASHGRPLRYRWKLLKAPRASQLWRRTQRRRHRGKRGIASSVRNLGPRAKPPRRRAVRSSARLDHPGVYRFRLTIIDPAGRRGSDRVSLRVDPPPLVPIDTMVKPKKSKVWGVKVGTQFYPDLGKNQQWLQVVALKAATQEEIWNRSYACPRATANPHVSPAALAAVRKCTEKVRKDVGSLSGSNAIVIAVSQRVNGAMARTKPWQTQPPVGFWTAILGQGGNIVDENYAHRATPLLRGRVSAVWRIRAGAKPIPWGRPVVEHDPHDLNRLTIGETAGFLVRDAAGKYSAFKGSQYVPYETQAAGSKPLANVMRVGARRFPSETNDRRIIRSGEGGFQAVMLDPISLQAVSETFRTRLVECGKACNVEAAHMKGWIASHAARHTVLLLTSVGDPRIDPGNLSNEGQKGVVNASVNELATLLTMQFGATKNRVYRALHDTGSTPAGPRSYTLVAAQGTKAGRGLEMEGPAGKAGANSVPQSGFLSREYAYEFVPQSSPVGENQNQAGAKLREVAFSSPGPWPEQGDPGRAAAIAWVGGQVGIDSRRSLYWTQPYKAGFWAIKGREIAKLAKPKKVSFSRANFAWAKAELQREIVWLGAAYAFAGNLAQPFEKGQIAAWKDVEGIANTIKEDVVKPPETTTTEELESQAVLQYAREIGGAIPGVSSGIRTVEATYNAVTGLIEAGNGRDANAPFSVKAGELGKALAERLELAQEAIEDELLDVVVADYRKLRTVALCGSLSRECPDKPLEQWQFTKVEQHNAAKPIKRGVETLVYSALLPIKYGAWLLPDSAIRATNHNQGHQVAGKTSTGNWCAFYQLPLSAQLAVPVGLNVADIPNYPETWRVVAYGRRVNKNGSVWKIEKPGANVTDPLFRPYAEKGLGANPEVFFRRTWTGDSEAKPLVNYPEPGAKVQWITADTPGFHPECGWPFHA